ncbi:MAG: hypothetical protein KGQ54_01005 [Verrucomicrobia bacterium]|nr:hypothetical protein [Verrucomicrobiota bacterium]
MIFLIFPLFLMAKIGVGKLELETSFQPKLVLKKAKGAAYSLDEDGSYLFLRELEDIKEVDVVLGKIEANLSPLKFIDVKMTTGRRLKVGTFHDPFLYPWVLVSRTLQYKGKKVLAMVIFHEERTKIDFFNLLDHLTILSV